MSQAGPLGLVNASMNGNLKEVQALLAAGAYKEARDEAPPSGGWVIRWAGRGNIQRRSGLGLCA